MYEDLDESDDDMEMVSLESEECRDGREKFDLIL